MYQCFSTLLRAAVPLVLVASIWWPEFDHFRIDRAVPSADVSDKLSHEPVTKRLAEIASFTFSVSLGVPPEHLSRVANSMLLGVLEAPSFFEKTLPLRGWPDDFSQGTSTFQLAMASLAAESLLLDEYDASGDMRFYALARDRVVNFAEYEAQQRMPIGFLWNDHAVAARIAVLIRVWRTLRDDPTATPPQRSSLLALVARSGELLAKPSQFTVRTNHGVMQNLALLQITAAFPELPNVPYWRALALSRLELQLGFYVSDEGVVLEHSSEYHVFGQELLGFAIQLAKLNGREPSSRLLKAHAGASEFSKHLAHPNGSLPLVGNTAGGIHGGDVSGSAPVPGSYPYPLSGYAIWWADDPTVSQTLVAWAKHDRHGHKHADEPSLHLWSRGVDWITAAGYWPYDERGIEEANGWQGANAPHAKGEASKSLRTVRLLATGEAGSLRVIDIENVRQSGLKVRRQVIQLNAERLLVLDSANEGKTPIDTIWTLDPRVSLRAIDSQRFVGSGGTGESVLQIALAYDDAVAALSSPYRGSWEPFAGWVVVGRRPIPAASLIVERAPGNSLTATLFTVANNPKTAALKLQKGSQVEAWAIEVVADPQMLRVQRQGQSIIVTTNAGVLTLNLTPAPSILPQHDALRASMDQAIKHYPPWRVLASYRHRLYLGIGSLWATIEISVWGLAWMRWRRRWMDAMVLAGWVAVAWWIHSIYLGYPAV